MSDPRWTDCDFQKAENDVDGTRPEEEAKHELEAVEDQWI